MLFGNFLGITVYLVVVPLSLRFNPALAAKWPQSSASGSYAIGMRTENPLPSTRKSNRLKMTTTYGGSPNESTTTQPVRFPCKALVEFTCNNGNCAPISRFCDGTNDCLDASDEPLGCSKCNRSLYGEVGSKYPLRLTEPLQRFHPFLCEIAFSAVGGRFGDIIELTFLSFQVGSFEITKDQTTSCPKGYLSIGENAEGLPFRGQSSLVGNSNGTSRGRFCGQMVVRKAIYYSEGNNLSLTISLPPGRAFYGHSLPFSLFLTYRFLTARTPFTHLTSTDLLTDFGMKVAQTYCDRVFEDCLPPRRCKIRSPNYPGFYPRNITCNFWVRQFSQVPKGFKARITVSQSNEYKISIYSGSSAGSTTTSKVNRGLTSDCPVDVIRIHDGPQSFSPKLAEFCGSGHLPPIVSSRPEVLVVLMSAPNHVMFDSRIELNIEIELVKTEETENEGHFLSNSVCDQTYDGEGMRSGVIRTPSHSIPPNVSCSYRFTSKNPEDRVWLYFVSYYVQDQNQWGNEERCDSSKLEIYDFNSIQGKPGEAPASSQSNQTSISFKFTSSSSSSSFSSTPYPFPAPTYRFCEKTSPKVCGRAADASKTGLSPATPCTYPEESYLSTGPHLVLKQYHFWSNNFYSSSGSFGARFEFIHTKEFGDPVEGTLCDRRFLSQSYPKGEVTSSRNLFLYGRGGRSNVSCSYHFIRKKRERLRIFLKSILLNSTHCHQTLDPVTGLYNCLVNPFAVDQKLSTLMLWDTLRSEQINVGCFCNGTPATQPEIVLDLIGPEVVLNFTITGMLPTEDYRDYGFEARFEYLSGGECNSNGVLEKRDGSRGEIAYSVPSGHRFEEKERNEVLKCRWLVQGSVGKHLYLKFRGFLANKQKDCVAKNRYIIYSGNPWKPMATVCAHEEPSGHGSKDSGALEEVNLFSLSWYNRTEISPYFPESFGKSASFRSSSGLFKVRLIVEVAATARGSFGLSWLEVTKPFQKDQETGETMRNTDCLYKCPELNACISPDLWCDGTNHCPSGFDESVDHCSTFPVLWVILASVGILVSLTLIIVAIYFTQIGKRKKKERKRDPLNGVPEVNVEVDERSFRNTFYPSLGAGPRPGSRHGPGSSASLRGLSSSLVDDFVPCSQREFDFQGFREIEDQEVIEGEEEEIINEATTGSRVISPPGYNPYDRPSFVTYYHRNVF